MSESVTIDRGANESPVRRGQKIASDLKTLLAEYVDKEFQKLTDQGSSFTC